MAAMPGATKSWGQECGEKAEDAVANGGEGVVDFTAPIALADESRKGQTAGVFADGLAGGSGQVLDGKEG